LKERYLTTESKLAELLFGPMLLFAAVYVLSALCHNLTFVIPDFYGIAIAKVWSIEGILFVLICSVWATRIQMIPAKILFRGSLVGLFYVLLVSDIAFHPETVKGWWEAFVSPIAGTIPSDELVVSCLALLLGPVLAMSMNLVYPRSGVRNALMEARVTNSLERLFHSVTIRARMVMLTLNDGKVYCGYINWIPPDPGANDSFLEIRPLFSGYREKDTRQVYLPVSYASFYTHGKKEDWVQFIKVIPIATITSAGEFDPKVFDEFGKHQSFDESNPKPLPNPGRWMPVLTDIAKIMCAFYVARRRRK